jgi:hypothetical protein
MVAFLKFAGLPKEQVLGLASIYLATSIVWKYEHGKPLVGLELVKELSTLFIRPWTKHHSFLYAESKLKIYSQTKLSGICGITHITCYLPITLHNFSPFSVTTKDKATNFMG